METNFEKWLKETLQNDPCYKYDIVCAYYDDCVACPLGGKCTKGREIALEYLDKPYTEN